MKVCYKCEEEKELSEFSQNKNKKDGLNSECKECQKEYFRNYYKNNKEKHIETVKKTNRYKKIELAKLKVRKGCCICGYNKHASALHFHHREDVEKRFTISSNYHHDLELLYEEAKKCDVVCANCHAVIHSKYEWDKENVTRPKKTKKRVLQTKSNTHKKSGAISKRKLGIIPDKPNINWPPKEILEKLVWEKTSEEIAKELNVSGSMLSRKCRQLGIEKPARGYWQKLNK